jgi:hypothetical protein
MKLNLGACDRQIDGFLSVDICPPADVIADLELPWPWDTSTVDEVAAFDIFEHIGNCHHFGPYICEKCYPHRRGKVSGCALCFSMPCMCSIRSCLGRTHVFNELYRVLKPGAVATIEVPSAAEGAGFAQDPTHVTPWCANSFQYFRNGSFAHNRLARAYGITARFEVLELSRRTYKDEYEDVVKITARLRAVK